MSSKDRAKLLKAEAHLDKFLIKFDPNKISDEQNLQKRESMKPLEEPNKLYVRYARFSKNVRKLQSDCDVTNEEDNKLNSPSGKDKNRCQQQLQHFVCDSQKP